MDKTNKTLYIIGCAVVLFCFTTKFILYSGFFIVLIAMILFAKKQLRLFPKELYFFVAIIYYNMFQIVFFSAQTANVEIERNLIYICVIITFANLKVDSNTHDLFWKGVIVFGFVLQCMQFFKIFDVSEYLIELYGENEAIKLSEYDNMTNFRSGSFFIAVNQYFKVIIMCLCVILLHIEKAKELHCMDNFLILICFLSVIFCGSRTGLIIFLAVILIHLRRYLEIASASSFRFFMVLLSLLLLVPFLINSQVLYNSRATDLLYGNSLSYKFAIIEMFLKRNSWLHILFGIGAYDGNLSDYMMDSDMGYFISYYGFFGLFFYILFLFYMCFPAKGMSVPYKLLFITILFLFLLGGVTSGLYFNYRVFSSILCMILPLKYMNKSNTIEQECSYAKNEDH